MAWLTIFAIYFVVWWLVLFMVLPFRVHNQIDAGAVVPGTEPGAPVMPKLWTKMAITSVIAAVATGLLFWGLSQPLIQEYWH